MSAQQKVLFRGDLLTSNAAVYSVPTATSAVVTSIIVSNSNVGAITVNVSLGSVALLTGAEVLGNDAIFVEFKQVLNELDTIEVSASESGGTIHISGVEIS